MWGVLGLLAAGYLGAASLMYLFQDRLLFLPGVPSREVTMTPEAVGLGFTNVTFSTEDGEQLDGWYVPATNARATLVHFHGNAGNIGHRLELLLIFHRLGLNVVLFDYRGYGRSTGSPGEEGIYRDAEAVWKFLTHTRGEAPQRIVLHGQSLGGAVAAHLAAKVRPAALILESSFTSAPDIAADVYPWLPARRLARLRFDARAACVTSLAQCLSSIAATTKSFRSCTVSGFTRRRPNPGNCSSSTVTTTADFFRARTSTEAASSGSWCRCPSLPAQCASGRAAMSHPGSPGARLLCRLPTRTRSGLTTPRLIPAIAVMSG